jgi:hypothetical protein
MFNVRSRPSLTTVLRLSGFHLQLPEIATKRQPAKRVCRRCLNDPDFQSLVTAKELCSCGSGIPGGKCCRLGERGVLFRLQHMCDCDEPVHSFALSTSLSVGQGTASRFRLKKGILFRLQDTCNFDSPEWVSPASSSRLSVCQGSASMFCPKKRVMFNLVQICEWGGQVHACAMSSGLWMFCLYVVPERGHRVLALTHV